MIRHWDPQGKYKKGFLREYDHWILEVSFRQHTLGCFIIFAKRKVEKISELRGSELIELRKVMKDIEDALIKLFNPGRFNYLQMGNSLHHLHFHGIPRYERSKKFAGKVWLDKTWGHNPVWTRTEVDNEFVIVLKKKILKVLA